MALETANTRRGELPLEQRPRERRRCQWFGLAVLWIFALVYLQYGLIDRLAVPADERVNNGRHATFFAVHTNPYYVFSEDFHLYALRSKRIADRGWTDSLLNERADARPSYALPLQAWLMGRAAATEGRPWPYAIFMVSVLVVAWTILYVAAARWMHPSISPLATPLALAVALLFESLGRLIHPFGEYGQWPTHRGLRMATIAWSGPLFLAAVIAAASLVTRPARPWGRAAFLAIAVVVFATGDTWSFLLGGASLGTAIVMLLSAAVFRRWRVVEGVRTRLIAAAALVGVCLVGTAVQRQFGAEFGGDAMTRAGFGPAWKTSPVGIGESNWIKNNVRADLKAWLAAGAVACLYGAVCGPRRGRLQTRWWLDWPTERRRFLLALFVIPSAGALVSAVAVSTVGMEAYHVFQFVWRTELVTLFVVALLFAEGAKDLIRAAARRWSVASLAWELAGAVAFLALLGGYHAWRTHEFVGRLPAREYFLTEDEEALAGWLKGRESFGRYSLATASHELNLLCAFWTDANLLLPEGFPLFSRDSQAEIERRTADLLAVYRTTPERWLEFNLYKHADDQWTWAVSRLLSARQGYMYYLMHRGIDVAGDQVGRRQSPLPPMTTHAIADQRLNRQKQEAAGGVERAKTGREAARRIALLLADKSREAPRPDVILVDETSRWLGEPDTAGYEREFQHGSLEAWVRRAP